MAQKKKENLKIVFVNAPLTKHQLQGDFEDVANVLPPLGIGYVAAVLEREGFTPKILDALVLGMGVEETVEELVKGKPDIVAFTSTVIFINATRQIAEGVKKALPQTLVVLGGPHISALPEETMQHRCFDIGVLGEGELTFLELAKGYVKDTNLAKDAKTLKGLKGTIFRSRGKLERAAPRPLIQDLDSLPFPAWHLYPPLKEYSPVAASCKKRPYMHMMSSRGCPYQCIFCDGKVFGKSARLRSVKNVVDEIEAIIDFYGAKEIRFFDDTFTIDRQRVIGICDEILRRKLDIVWTAITRVNHVDPELLKKMREAGCWQISYGLESGSQRMLNIMKKGATIGQGKKAVIWTKEAGMDARAYFVFGIPGETLESLQETIDFAKSLPLDVVTFYNVTLMPGNELFQLAQKEGTILHHNYEHYNPSISDDTMFAYLPEGMSKDDLRKAVKRAHKEFYLRPSYILRQLFAIRSLADVNQRWIGLKLILGM